MKLPPKLVRAALLALGGVIGFSIAASWLGTTATATGVDPWRIGVSLEPQRVSTPGRVTPPHALVPLEESPRRGPRNAQPREFNGARYWIIPLASTQQ